MPSWAACYIFPTPMTSCALLTPSYVFLFCICAEDKGKSLRGQITDYITIHPFLLPNLQYSSKQLSRCHSNLPQPKYKNKTPNMCLYAALTSHPPNDTDHPSHQSSTQTLPPPPYQSHDPQQDSDPYPHHHRPHHQSTVSTSSSSTASSPPPPPPQTITPHRLRSQLLVNNLKASGILPYNNAKWDLDPIPDDTDADNNNNNHNTPARLAHSARWLEAIGFDENRSMYSSYQGDADGMGCGGWGNAGKSEKKKRCRRGAAGGKKRRFLKRLVLGRGEGGKGEKL